MTLKQGQRSNLTFAEDLQNTISKKVVSNSKPLGPMIREVLGFSDMPPSPPPPPPPPFDIKDVISQHFFKTRPKQEGQRCPKRRVAQAAIRLATALITFRNKERNVRLPS